MKRKLVFTVLVVSTAALFSGSDSVTPVAGPADVGAGSHATEATDTVDISISPSTDLVTFIDFMPGDSTTNAVVVRNRADGQSFRYSISSVADDTDRRGLEAQLVMIVRTGDNLAPAPCAAFTGTTLYRGDLGPSDGRLVGDATPGPDAGDRTLAQGTSETLCFQVGMPLSTGNRFQGSATNVAITFTAEPTAPEL